MLLVDGADTGADAPNPLPNDGADDCDCAFWPNMLVEFCCPNPPKLVEGCVCDAPNIGGGADC